MSTLLFEEGFSISARLAVIGLCVASGRAGETRRLKALKNCRNVPWDWVSDLVLLCFFAISQLLTSLFFFLGYIFGKKSKDEDVFNMRPGLRLYILYVTK